MKILEITVRSDIGGGPKHVLDLIQNLPSHEVEIFLASPLCGEYADAFKKFATEFIEIPHRKFKIKTFFELIAFCKRNDIELIHSHGRGAGIYSRLMKIFGFKVVHTFHGVHIEKTTIGKIKLLADKLLKTFTSKFICVSESEKNNALANKITIGKKTTVIHNGVAIPESVKKEKSDKIVLGTLSRLNYQKGLDILLDFFYRFESETDLSFTCLIAGDGELKKELSMANKCQNVKFVGAVDGKEFLQTIDIYISFARWEGLPLAVLEAMSHSKACLLSNVEGNTDIIQEGNGILFDLNSYEDFKTKILQICHEDDFRLSIEKNAKESVEKYFSLNQMCQKTLEVYKEVVSK